jgi:hypothetical protein
MKLLFMLFPLAIGHFCILRPKNSPHNPVLKHLQSKLLIENLTLSTFVILITCFVTQTNSHLHVTDYH